VHFFPQRNRPASHDHTNAPKVVGAQVAGNGLNKNNFNKFNSPIIAWKT
jgi:hypothetical protein